MLGLGPYQNVEIAGRARRAMKSNGVRAYDEIINILLVQQGAEIEEVLLKNH